MIPRRLRTVTCLALILGAPSLALAHIRLDAPKGRDTPNLKTGPCGASSAGVPQELEGWTAGATVTIEYTETIDHPSHYRVALSREGESTFIDPEDADDKETDGNELRDDIEDLDEGNNRAGTFEVVLPDEPCENCVLQLMQIMYDKPSAPFYYQCADVVIAPSQNNGSGGSAATEGTGGATGVGGADGSGGEESGGTSAGSGGTASGSGGAAASAGGSISAGGAVASGGGSLAAGGAVTSVGGGDPGDDGPGSSGGGGCSLGQGPVRLSSLGLVGLVLLGAFGGRRLRARS